MIKVAQQWKIIAISTLFLLFFSVNIENMRKRLMFPSLGHINEVNINEKFVLRYILSHGMNAELRFMNIPSFNEIFMFNDSKVNQFYDCSIKRYWSRTNEIFFGPHSKKHKKRIMTSMKNEQVILVFMILKLDLCHFCK